MGYLPPDYCRHQSPVVELRCGYDPLSKKKRRWDARLLRYYVSGELASKKNVPLFSAFLFTPIQSGYGRFMDPLFMGFSKPSNQADWLEWLFELVSPDRYLHQLASAAHASKAHRELDIWITLPYPQLFQHEFGLVDQAHLNFRWPADRERALSWWIDKFLEKWNQASFKHPMRLRGFRWPREAMMAEDDLLIAHISAKLKSHDLQLMWLTNYGAARVHEWKEAGFDIALIHSNYTGNTDIPPEWIDYSAYFAQTYTCGLQLIIGRGMLFDRQHMYQYYARGLFFQRNYLSSAFLLYSFPGTDLVELRSQRRELYNHLVLLVHGVRNRNISDFLAACERKLPGL